MIITNDSVTTVLQGETYLKVLPCNKFDKKKHIPCFILLNIYPCYNLMRMCVYDLRIKV